jgi:hypothetical protein
MGKKPLYIIITTRDTLALKSLAYLGFSQSLESSQISRVLTFICATYA